ncbi:hypothetical protein [Chroococcidiopsis sp. TS-821]|nr:hypothetical protein [Chroococcidiopsis sp. TS-821]
MSLDTGKAASSWNCQPPNTALVRTVQRLSVGVRGYLRLKL